MPRIKEGYRGNWLSTHARTPTTISYSSGSSAFRPDEVRYNEGVDKSIVTSVINRIAVDVSQITFKHVRVNLDNKSYTEDMDTGLNECLTIGANIDQTAKAFIKDVVISLCDEGNIAIIPTASIGNPLKQSTFDPTSLRVARILRWFPRYVEVEYYNDITGKMSRFIYPKQSVCIINNPFYAVMNEPNGSVQRLKKKLIYLDGADAQTSSGKLDLIIQLPYSLKGPARKQQANERKAQIENQLVNSKFGIAYIDNTEKITQLNRPIENNLLKQIEYLTEEVYSQLGVSKELLMGKAEPQEITNYQQNTIMPFVNAIVDEMRRKFLTKRQRSNGQDIMSFTDPFNLIPLASMAELADKLTRNEIMTSNEIRQKIGLKPSEDPKADMLINSNLNHDPSEMGNYGEEPQEGDIEYGPGYNGE